MKILIVDDQQTNLVLFESLIGKLGDHQSLSFTDPTEALAWCARNTPDLVILDYRMPDLNGLEFLKIFRARPECREIPLLMITADHEKGLRYQALQLSSNDFLTKPIDKIEFSARVANMLRLRQHQLALSDRAALLSLEVEKATAEIRLRERDTIMRLASAAEYRDPETGAHIQRMAHYAQLIARNLNLPAADQKILLRAAPMHDIGKVGIPDQILLKPGKLSAEEFDIIKTHSQIGYDILRDSSSELLEAAALLAYSHHEKFDGSGYPRGLSGTGIPLFGRICAVADVFDALTSVRPYKPAWPFEAALATLREGRGSHFDPDCLDAFLLEIDQIKVIRTLYADDEELARSS